MVKGQTDDHISCVAFSAATVKCSRCKTGCPLELASCNDRPEARGRSGF